MLTTGAQSQLSFYFNIGNLSDKLISRWCRCTALPNDLDGFGGRQTKEFTEELLDTLDSDRLWDEYGIDDDIIVRGC